MNKIIFLLFVFFNSFTILGQVYINMTDKLSDVNGHLIIDGNTLQHERGTKEQIIITGEDLILNDRSSFVFNNIILQLTGKIIVKGTVKPALIDTHIFCKDSGDFKSPNVMETTNFEDIIIAEVPYIKELKGNPMIWIYNRSGKRIFKGTKKQAEGSSLPVSKYDVKVAGIGFKDNVLFINM